MIRGGKAVIKTADDFLAAHERLRDTRKDEILQSADEISITGCTYYVSSDGDDENDGLSSDCPWKTIERVSCAEFCVGDGVRFRMGDLFRG